MTKRLPYPLVLALCVLCLVLGGTGGALAGARITGKQIKNESVTGKDVKDRSLTRRTSPPGLSPSQARPGRPALPAPTGTPGTNGTNGFSGLAMTPIHVGDDRREHDHPRVSARTALRARNC